MDPSPLEERLLRIPTYSHEQTYRLLQWLAFVDEPFKDRPDWQRQPFTLAQLAETTLIPLSGSNPLESQSLPPHEVIELLAGVAEPGEVCRDRCLGDTEKIISLRFLEGVREYLLSDACAQGPACNFAFSRGKGREIVAYDCLLILTGESEVTAEASSLAPFAALFWSEFIDITDLSPRCADAIRKLFAGDRRLFYRWIDLLSQSQSLYPNITSNNYLSTITSYLEKRPTDHAPPIAWASALNLDFIVEALLMQGDAVNERGLGGATALYMATHQEHFDIAARLLQGGGDVSEDYDEPTGKYEYGREQSPFYLAVHRGHSREWIEMFLQDRTKLGKPGWKLEVAMESAAQGGRVETLKALLDASADVDHPTENEEHYGCPLQAACDHANEETVRFLLDMGANPNTAGGKIWLGEVHTPLQMAAYRGNLSAVELLLSHGADPNVQGGMFGTALMAAIWNLHNSHEEGFAVVKVLLEHGANLDMEWDMTMRIHELNFTYYEERKVPTVDLFGEKTAIWIKSREYDPSDEHPGSEATLRAKIDEKWVKIHNGQFGRCRCMNKEGTIALIPNRNFCLLAVLADHASAFERRFRVCTKIRRSAALISKRLHEGGVSSDDQVRYLMNPIQAAVAMERPRVIELLLEYGVELPAVIVPKVEEEGADAEDVARLLRTRDSFSESIRSKDGNTGGSSSGMLP
ncbi:MAG: hypothetical protein Q9191_006571 [Dirinaria sp. TL-2023a]